MSGSRVPHLQRRHGTYHLRVRVPDDLRVRVGLREIRRSLRVHTFAQARPLALKYATRVMEVFEIMRTQDINRDQVLDLVRRCFHDLATEVDDGFQPRREAPDMEIDYQTALFHDHSTEVANQLSSRNFDHPVTTRTARLIKDAGLDVAQVGRARLIDLHIGTARALLERDRLFLFRLDEGLLPYDPTDPLFAGAQNTSAYVHTMPQQQVRPLGPTVGAALDTYLAFGEKRWAGKTHVSRTRQLGFLREHLGADRPIASVSSADIVSYRDALGRLRVQSKRENAGSFLSQQTENEEARISHTTAENLFNPCKAFFAWAKGEQGLIVQNPADGVRFPKVKQSKAKTSRRPFQKSELIQLFSAPVFTGMKKAKRRFDPGTVVVKDAHYWLPILGYYTGARLGELVQLHVSDVHLAGPAPYFEITEEGGGEKGSGKEKSVKSLAGVRKVPLHPDLIALGFGDLVTKTAEDQRANNRLFWQVGFGADGQASTVFSKWFALLMDKAGLPDPALVFHSFRHTMADAFDNALTPPYVIDKVLGHASGKVSDSYGHGISIEVAHKALVDAKLPIRLIGLVK